MLQIPCEQVLRNPKPTSKRDSFRFLFISYLENRGTNEENKNHPTEQKEGGIFFGGGQGFPETIQLGGWNLGWGYFQVPCLSKMTFLHPKFTATSCQCEPPKQPSYLASHYTGCLIVILIMDSYNHHPTRYYNPIYTLNNLFLFIAQCGIFVFGYMIGFWHTKRTGPEFWPKKQLRNGGKYIIIYL